MFELLFLFLVIFGFVVMIKLGGFLLHILFIPFQIIGGLFVALLAAPLLIILMPIVIIGLMVAGFALLSLMGIVAGGLLGCIC